ncbi:hypothetical protein BRD02_01960 [Halobacteriales archaeon QS_8_69_73]|nr:MAG: hypothetical protein BRD02_01960 [Halobacteriales archaeon QS_8_69_73]
MDQINIADVAEQLDENGEMEAESMREVSFSLQVMRFEPGDEDPMHAHAEEEVYVIHTGEATLVTEDESVEARPPRALRPCDILRAVNGEGLRPSGSRASPGDREGSKIPQAVGQCPTTAWRRRRHGQTARSAIDGGILSLLTGVDRTRQQERSTPFPVPPSGSNCTRWAGSTHPTNRVRLPNLPGMLGTPRRTRSAIRRGFHRYVVRLTEPRLSRPKSCRTTRRA